MDYHWPALVTEFALFLLFGVAWNVGRARSKYKIAAPATSGHPKFDLAYRVQMNTVESTLIFLPALWLFAWYASTAWAGVIGGIWLAARLWYAVAYSQDAAKRGPGFIVSMLAVTVLAIGGLAGILKPMW